MNIIKMRTIQKFIMTEFASGRINTQSDVDEMIRLIIDNLDMSRVQAASFFRNSIM